MVFTIVSQMSRWQKTGSTQGKLYILESVNCLSWVATWEAPMSYKIGHRFWGLDPAFCDQLANFKLLIWLTIIESLWSLVNSPHYFRSAHVKIWLNRQWIYVYSRLDRLFVAISRRQKKGPADRKGPNVCYWKWFFFSFWKLSPNIWSHHKPEKLTSFNSIQYSMVKSFYVSS